MPEQQPPPKLSAATVFERLLTYADKPWKAIVILVAVVICGAGWIVWTERVRIADAMLTGVNERATLNEAAFISEAPRLLRDTRADITILAEVDLTDNVSVDRIGITPDGHRWVPSTGPQQALRPESSMPLLVKFLANEVSCTNAADAVNEDMRGMAAAGYMRACIISVPPILGTGVGALVVAWKRPPDADAERRAGYAMKSAAMKFATW